MQEDFLPSRRQSAEKFFKLPFPAPSGVMVWDKKEPFQNLALCHPEWSEKPQDTKKMADKFFPWLRMRLNHE
jgi:hypothetical protein